MTTIKRMPIFRMLSLSLSVTGCLHDPANVEQTSSKCIQNTARANAGRLLDHVNTLSVSSWAAR